MFKFTQYVLFPIWFSFFSPINLENIFQPHLFKRHPSRFMSIRHFLYPKRSLPFSSISLKNYIPPPCLFQRARYILYLPVLFCFRFNFYPFRWWVNKIIYEPTSISKRPSCFINSHHVLFPMRFLSFLSQSAQHVLYLPAHFYIQYNFYPSLTD